MPLCRLSYLKWISIVVESIDNAMANAFHPKRHVVGSSYESAYFFPRPIIAERNPRGEPYSDEPEYMIAYSELKGLKKHMHI